MNRTLEEMLRAYTTYNQNQWDEYLPAAEFAYNNSKQASTGHTPFELDCGQHPATPVSLATNKPTIVPAADEFIQQWNDTIRQAKDALMIAKERQSKYANQHRQHVTYKVGNQVLLSTQNIKTPVDKNRPTRKLSPKYVGPYTIIAVISSTAYKLELPHTMKIHPVFHVSMLKPYQADEFGRNNPPPPPIIINNNNEYEVESVLDKRTFRGKMQYLVKWLGYPLYDATWEPVGNLQNCKEKIKEFEATRTLHS
jgi:hypothetical protein